MSDPIFESFKQPVEVAPPDAREIRRRGDRRRRRTAIATVAGAALVVAAVVAPVAALTSGDERTGPPVLTPSPSPSPSPSPDGAWVQVVPDGFPLADGVPMPGEGIAQVRHDVGSPLTVCGTELWSADHPEGWVDVATATNADDVDPADGTTGRTLALYADETGAKRVLATLAEELDACSVRQYGDIRRVGDSDAWALRLVATSSPEGELITVVRAGNALLLQRDGLQTGLGVEEQLGYVLAGQESVVAAMCVFAAEPCPGSAPTSPQGETNDPTVAHVDEIPADFPIDEANEAVGSEFTESRPSPDGDRVAFDPCGTEAFAIAEQDRLAFQVTGPEYGDNRELRTYPSADDAVTQMERLRTAVLGRTQRTLTAPRPGALTTSTPASTRSRRR
jgi:hypothetical protein